MQCFDDIERSDIIPIIVVVALCMAPIVGGAWGYVAGYGPYVILTLGVTTAICFVIFGLVRQRTILWRIRSAAAQRPRFTSAENTPPRLYRDLSTVATAGPIASYS